jgi:leader peptidase (prepilin peptidase) / N-methyltransferase
MAESEPASPWQTRAPPDPGKPRRQASVSMGWLTHRVLWVPLIVFPAALGIAAFSFATFSLELAVVSCLLGWTMLAIAVIDANRLIIPDILSLPAIPAGLLASGRLLEPSTSDLVRIDHAIGMLAGGLGLWLVRALYFRIRQREGLGLGDVKLAAAGGAWIGWQSLSDAILLAAAMALSLIIVLAVMRGKELSAAAKVPFGCFLAPSIWLVWALAAYGRTL